MTSVSLSVRLNIVLGGMTPLYFHMVNVCLHCAVTCLLMLTCQRCVFEDSRLAFITALLFAVHPVHTEAVSNTLFLFQFLRTLTQWHQWETQLSVEGAGNNL